MAMDVSRNEKTDKRKCMPGLIDEGARAVRVSRV